VGLGIPAQSNAAGGNLLASLNPDARLMMCGQERNPESYAICKAFMLINDQDVANFICRNMLPLDKYSVRCAS
jgi:type I restriction enzyme M protein